MRVITHYACAYALRMVTKSMQDPVNEIPEPIGRRCCALVTGLNALVVLCDLKPTWLGVCVQTDSMSSETGEQT